MFDAQILKAESGSTVSVLGPWMQREGDRAVCTLDLVLRNDGSPGPDPELKVELYTKAHEDAGDGAAAGTMTIETSTIGRSTAEWGADLKDLVRYKFTFDPKETDSWVLFRMLPMVWFDAVEV